LCPGRPALRLIEHAFQLYCFVLVASQRIVSRSRAYNLVLFLCACCRFQQGNVDVVVEETLLGPETVVVFATRTRDTRPNLWCSEAAVCELRRSVLLQVLALIWGPYLRQKASDGNGDLASVWLAGELAATQSQEMGPKSGFPKWFLKMGPKNRS